MIEFRKIKTTDYETCANALIAAFNDEPWNENWTFEQAFTRIDEIMSGRVSRGYIALDGDVVVGMLVGRIMTYLEWKEVFIDEFSVHPAYQGKKIGSDLLDFAQKQLAQEGITNFALNTESDKPAVQFYEKNNFKIKDNLVFMVKKF